MNVGAHRAIECRTGISLNVNGDGGTERKGARCLCMMKTL